MKQKNILLTGAPGSGKTTLIRRVLERYRGMAGGFYTREIRAAGARKGFEIRTLDGRAGVLAHVNIRGRPRVGKYGVDLKALEHVAVPVLLEAVERGWLVVIDEIGPMEMLSAVFCDGVEQALDADARVLGTVVRRSTPFGDRVKARQDVQVVEVHPGNRDALTEKVASALMEGSA